MNKTGLRRLTGNTRIVWKVIGKVDEARPDGFEAALQEVASLHSENCRPHKGNESLKD